nr:immunoglobulin light chain junction region [Macaca mulatta]
CQQHSKWHQLTF